jgi:hypothetical protein
VQATSARKSKAAESKHGMGLAGCRGTISTVQEIVKAGGIRGLWQGTGPSVLRVGLGAALQFVVLEQVKTLLSVQLADGSSQLSAMGAAISGGMGWSRHSCSMAHV